MSDVVADGVAAWSRLRRRERASWQDWLAVGHALIIGRSEALAQAGTNRAVGSRYNKAMGQWLADHGLAEITASERYRLMLIVENLSAIEQWRAGIAPEARRRFNHPNSVWSHWRASVAPRASAAPPRRLPSGGGDRPVYFSQDHIRRAAEAIRKANTTDTHSLARAALQAAIRTESDVRALINEIAPSRRTSATAPATGAPALATA